jgi:hypothetical protein
LLRIGAFAIQEQGLTSNKNPKNCIEVFTWAISSDELIILALSFKWLTTESTARLIPHRRSMGFILAATDLQPSEKMACVSTVAAVVPATQPLNWKLKSCI